MLSLVFVSTHCRHLLLLSFAHFVLALFPADLGIEYLSRAFITLFNIVLSRTHLQGHIPSQDPLPSCVLICSRELISLVSVSVIISVLLGGELLLCRSSLFVFDILVIPHAYHKFYILIHLCDTNKIKCISILSAPFAPVIV